MQVFYYSSKESRPIDVLRKFSKEAEQTAASSVTLCPEDHLLSYFFVKKISISLSRRVEYVMDGSTDQ